jgi:5-formyltetrahydrofolate cyclo-ligase
LCKKIIEFKPYQESKRIGIYLSMPTGEIQTDPIVHHAIASGKKVFVPYLHKNRTPSPDTPRSVMDMVDLSSLSDYDSMTRDSWGIPTIGADTIGQREHILKDSTNESEPLDMILMPGVAFDIDPKGGFIRRLGHGKGFYDYFLHRYMQCRGLQVKGRLLNPGADGLLYGLALKEQFLEVETELSVAVGEHDHLLHGLLVGDGRLLEAPVTRE